MFSRKAAAVDETLFDRITRTLAGSAHRRATLRASAAAALGGIVVGIAEAKKKKKKRCRKRLERCGDGKRCCNGSGRIKCQIVQAGAKPACDSLLGRRCCGIDGATCDPAKNDCDCCPNTFCDEVDGQFRCREPLT